MTSYLLVIGDREALGWILTAERMAFPSASRREVAALEAGDGLFLYTTRGAYKNPTRDRGRVIGTATVRTPVERLAEPVQFGDRESRSDAASASDRWHRGARASSCIPSYPA